MHPAGTCRQSRVPFPSLLLSSLTPHAPASLRHSALVDHRLLQALPPLKGGQVLLSDLHMLKLDILPVRQQHCTAGKSTRKEGRDHMAPLHGVQREAVNCAGSRQPAAAAGLLHLWWRSGLPWAPPEARCWAGPGRCRAGRGGKGGEGSWLGMQAPGGRVWQKSFPGSCAWDAGGATSSASWQPCCVCSPTTGEQTSNWRAGQRPGCRPRLADRTVMSRWPPRSSTLNSVSLRRGSTTRHSPRGSSTGR